MAQSTTRIQSAESGRAAFGHSVTDLFEGQLAFLSHIRAYEEQLKEIADDIASISGMRSRQDGWAVKSSKALSGLLRHNQKLKLGKYLEATMEQIEESSVRPFSWALRKFFAFLMANSKGRFQTWIAPTACSFERFLDWDFSIGVSAIQGHSRLPEQVSEVACGEWLIQQRCGELGCIFHASENRNYESIKRDGLLLRATRHGWQRHRMAIHFVYAGGSASPGPGTVVRYGSNIFYEQLDIGRLKHEEKQRAARASSSFEEAAPSAADCFSAATGGSPSGEVPMLDQESLRRLIREDELREAAKRSTAEEGTTRYSYEAGDTVHGRVDGIRLQQEEELRDIIQK
ncbi:unnamed protein product, partial [Symbiodinium necroappetens]